MSFTSNYGCTGALLNDRWVISTVTCTNYYLVENTLILVGAVSQREGDVYICEAIKNHENFDSATLENDIALLRSNRPILFTQYVQPIPYFRGPLEPCKTTLVGYKEVHNGMFSSGNYWTFYMEVSTISKRECQALLSDLGRPELYDAKSICVLAKIDDSDSYYLNDICMNRGGEPLVPSGSRVLLGLSSRKMYDCTSNSPFAFTEVSQFSDWIESNTNVTGVDVL
ncbi:chymotrypsin-2-like [Bradysia coprophila]|uniref:chymotrypsin-2-like n=1 Tax=Bradysia coprophila TaxID=38358 RepID=UPI00187D9FAE|nr:chymotrypsin-2-like [Bradysia coprophila]